MSAQNILFLVPILPLVGAALNGLLGRRFPRALVGPIACAGPLVAFALSVLFVFELQGSDASLLTNTIGTWISVGTLDVPFTFVLDDLSSIMILMVTGVGSLIHIYSIGYMRDDPGYPRYFAYLNLFMSMMLVLVLADSLVLLFLGWEGVGLCSYLLIGFWYTEDANATAGKKAFVVNRVGDLAFAIGMFLIFVTYETLSARGVVAKASGDASAIPESARFWIPLLLFIGATGKSAQIPLYVWLPDAMAGPTPVSALIHAATMVTSGVYMVARLGPVYDLSPAVMGIVATVGALTAIVAGFIALTQYDIKKVLAYSTVSQLGYMFLAAGLGAYGVAIFHLVTHAFFKGLLFLGSGAVIYSLHHEQDMRRMGGLRKQLPVTFVLMLVGSLAIAGLPLFSGFYSKDAILETAMEHNTTLWIIGSITAVLTSFYVFRMMAMTFFGESNYGNDEHAEDQSDELLANDHGHGPHAGPIHESPAVMLAPMGVLALLSIAGGIVFHGIPHAVQPSFEASHDVFHALVAPAGLVGAGLFATGLIAAWILYGKAPALRDAIAKRNPIGRGLWKLSNGKLFVDELYSVLVVKPLDMISNVLFVLVDRLLIDGLLVGGSALATRIAGSVLRQFQTGRVPTYAGWMVGGAIALMVVIVSRSLRGS